MSITVPFPLAGPGHAARCGSGWPWPPRVPAVSLVASGKVFISGAISLQSLQHRASTASTCATASETTAAPVARSAQRAAVWRRRCSGCSRPPAPPAPPDHPRGSAPLARAARSTPSGGHSVTLRHRRAVGGVETRALSRRSPALPAGVRYLALALRRFGFAVDGHRDVRSGRSASVLTSQWKTLPYIARRGPRFRRPRVVSVEGGGAWRPSDTAPPPRCRAVDKHCPPNGAPDGLAHALCTLIGMALLKFRNNFAFVWLCARGAANCETHSEKTVRAPKKKGAGERRGKASGRQTATGRGLRGNRGKTFAGVGLTIIGTRRWWRRNGGHTARPHKLNSWDSAGRGIRVRGVKGERAAPRPAANLQKIVCVEDRWCCWWRCRGHACAGWDVLG